MGDVVMIEPQALTWSAHPDLADVRLAWLMRREAGAPLSCALVAMADGATVPEHRHAEEDDILYVLRGTASMWIENAGEHALAPGTFLRVPRGLRHRPHDFAGGFLAFDIWAPHAA